MKMIRDTSFNSVDVGELNAITGDSKICRCGKVYPLNDLPPNKEANGIIYFYCKCEAILFIPKSALIEKGSAI